MIPFLITFQLLEEIFRFFEPTRTVQGIEPVVSIVPYIIVGVIIGLLYIIFRINKNLKAFPDPDNIVGKMTLQWQGNYWFKANISRLTEPILPSTIEQLKATPWFTKGAEELEFFIKEKKLYLYEANLLEWDDALHLAGNKKEPTLIISSADLSSEKFSWDDKKSQFDWGTMRKETNRAVFLHESSRHYESETIDENPLDVFIVAPIPRADVGEHEPVGFDDEQCTLKSHNLEVEVLPNMAELAKIVPYLVAVAKQNEIIRNKNIQLDKLKILLEERDSLLNKAQRENDMLRILKADEPLIGEVDRKEAEEKPFPWIWVIMCGVGALVGSQLPTQVQELRGFDPMLTGFIGIATVVALIWMTTRKKNETGFLTNES